MNRVSISASPAHRLLMGRGTGEAKAKMGREITFTRGNVERCHSSGLRIGSRRRAPDLSSGRCPRLCLSQSNIGIEVVKVLPIAPQPVQIRAGCEAGASAQALRCKADAATTDSVWHWNAKAPRGQASNVDRAVRRTNGSLSGVKNVRCPGGAFKGMSGSGTKAGIGCSKDCVPATSAGRAGWAGYGTGKERFLLLLYHTGGGEIKGCLAKNSRF